MVAVCTSVVRLGRCRLSCATGIAVAVVALGTSGCATTTHAQMVAFLRAHETEVATGQYVVRPPDVIAFHTPGAPEIDGASQMVRADGKVSLRLLGEVDVAGLTTEEIASKIEAQLSRFYVDPEVVVQVAAYNSQFFYIFGEVTSPGPKRFTGRDTLMMALAEARPTFLAWSSQIKVIRPSLDGEEPKVITVNLDDMLSGGDQSMNVLLQEGDIIQVPPTPLAWVGHRVRELLYPVDPVIEMYGKPADVINSNETYRDEWGNSSGDGNAETWRKRFGR